MGLITSLHYLYKFSRLLVAIGKYSLKTCYITTVQLHNFNHIIQYYNVFVRLRPKPASTHFGYFGSYKMTN